MNKETLKEHQKMLQVECQQHFREWITQSEKENIAPYLKRIKDDTEINELLQTPKARVYP